MSWFTESFFPGTNGTTYNALPYLALTVMLLLTGTALVACCFQSLELDEDAVKSTILLPIQDHPQSYCSRSLLSLDKHGPIFHLNPDRRIQFESPPSAEQHLPHHPPPTPESTALFAARYLLQPSGLSGQLQKDWQQLIVSLVFCSVLGPTALVAGIELIGCNGRVAAPMHEPVSAEYASIQTEKGCDRWFGSSHASIMVFSMMFVLQVYSFFADLLKEGSENKVLRLAAHDDAAR